MNIQPGFLPPPEPALYLGRLSSALRSMESAKCRKYNYQFEKLINDYAMASFSAIDETARKEIEVVSREYQNIINSTTLSENLSDASVNEIRSLGIKIEALSQRYFQGHESSVKHQLAFDNARAHSLAYLASWDHRGLWGWEKVDKTIRPLVKAMHENPHTFHDGESCEGHISEPSSYQPEAILSGGYIYIGIDGTSQSLEIIAKIQAIAAESCYVTLTQNKTCMNVDCFDFRVNIDNLTEADRKAKGLEEHKAEFDKIWKRVETVFLEAAAGSTLVNWQEEITKDLHLVF